jgi:lipopolysaccharide/colanic/teichoic acid biosynthesis glycosyltransferase
MSMLDVTTPKWLRREHGAVLPDGPGAGAAADLPRAGRGWGAKRSRAWRLLRYWALALTCRPRLVDYDRCKRLIDVAGSAFLLVVLLPFCAAVAALIKLSDGGPVLFWQTRVGRWGRAFAMPKFRSMVTDAEGRLPALLGQNDPGGAGVVRFKMQADPRVTWVGRALRRFSIDELPQLWSVLRGDMSLVGPRPPLPREVAHYTARDRLRLEAVPGLTCIWQVSGRSRIPFARQVEMDIEYLHKQSLWFDLKLILRTIPAVLFRDGAY